MITSFNLTTLLKISGFTDEMLSKTLFVRHNKTRNSGIAKSILSGEIEDFQAIQKMNFFKDCEYAVVFIGEKPNTANFHGIYKVTGKSSLVNVPKFKEKNWWDDSYNSMYYHELIPMENLSDLSGRLVVNWESSSWHQKAAHNKSIVAILSPIPFSNFQDVNLSFSQLEKIIYSEYPDWISAMSNVCAVYLITTPKGLYVGAAYSQDGLYNRWAGYAKTKHNDVVRLKEIIKEEPDIYKQFHFSVLKVLPLKSTEDEVKAWEQYFKDRFNTQNSEWGLNKN